MKISVCIVALILILGCNQTDQQNNPEQPISSSGLKNIIVPDFNADSAYAFIYDQVAFGPRVPNTAAHDSCANYLSEKLKSFGFSIMLQNDESVAYDGTLLKFTNIIASLNKENKDRIMLCAHWDTRPFSEQDPIFKNKPIDGANDGGSGVGVLLEIARSLAMKNPVIGIDIVLFDAEDYGKSNVEDSYCLGSQHWAQNLHVKDYSPRYGILLDMVGAQNATFTMEGYSMMYAPYLVKKIWKTAAKLGYSHHFPFKKTNPITDDHYYINKLGSIQCVDIIQHDPTTITGFGTYWHTQNDKLEIIDKNTLKAVGQTLLVHIFNESQSS